MKFRGTNSVNPPLSFWISLIVAIWFTRSSFVSRCPNIIVDVDFIPSLCAVLIISTQSSTVILPGEILSLKSWFKISAAVPGIVSTPASFSLIKYSLGDIACLVAPYKTSSGENP